MSAITDEDLAAWCDEHLPDLYDEGMYDHEDAAEEVFAALETVIEETLCGTEDDEELAEKLHTAATVWFQEYHELRITALNPVDAITLATFRQKPQVDQHSAEWYAQRRNRLTASEFAQILDGRRAALLRSKVYPSPAASTPMYTNKSPVAIAQSDGEMNATSWGHRFESVTRRIYELEIAGVDTVADDLGRFTHHTIPWLSASPDGLVMRGPLAGRLVEIKSPKTRQPGQYVPDDYYVQMQLQMEVCDLEAVDFVEAQFAQRTMQLIGFGAASTHPDPILSDPDAAAMEAAPWKGRIQVWGDLEDAATWIYRYTEPVEDLEDAAFTTTEPTGLALLESSVWWLTGWYPRTVLRSRTWWDAVGWPNAELFWAEVESLRTALPEQTETDDAATIEHVGRWLGSA
jgi:hypothetical protein